MRSDEALFESYQWDQDDLPSKGQAPKMQTPRMQTRDAQDMATKAFATVEAAFSQWTSLIAESGQRIRHALELADKSRKEIVEVKESIIEAAEPLRPAFRVAAEAVNRFGRMARRRPISFSCLLAGLFAGGIFIGTRARQSSRQLVLPPPDLRH